MITNLNIGYNGRLGNQMFQFASLIGIANKNNYEAFVPSQNLEKRPQYLFSGETVDTWFELPEVFPKIQKFLHPSYISFIQFEKQEQQFNFDRSFFNIRNSTTISGYFQTERYFKHVESKVRDLFTFAPEIQEKAEDVFFNIPSDLQRVAIHIRRGDYVNNQQSHPFPGIDYYAKALKHFEDKPYIFLIFSDDIEFSNILFGEQENIYYVKEDSYTSLCLMTMCDHFIIANSSFSWWGAWLARNESKRVIAPSTWFGPALSQNNTEDLYCKEWIKI